MALTKQTKLKIEILDNGTIQLQKATFILEDGVTIAGPKYHRSVYTPGTNVSTKPQRLRDIAALVWTPQVIADFEAAKAEGRRRGPFSPVRVP